MINDNENLLYFCIVYSLSNHYYLLSCFEPLFFMYSGKSSVSPLINEGNVLEINLSTPPNGLLSNLFCLYYVIFF